MAASHDLRHWLDSGARAMKAARSRLDEINVFPVPDSDTGTNIYLTLHEGNRAVARLPEDASHREVVAAFARGALLGARGNSGVIISQYLTTFLAALDSHGGLARIKGPALAAALAEAADAAYLAVAAPVEGTILTTARAAADGAAVAAGAKATSADTAVAAVVAARAALTRTHAELPAARAAGVVDAGAAGLVLQLEMLAEAIAGSEALASLDDVAWELGDGGARVSTAGLVAEGGAYEVMFVVHDAHDIRASLTARLEAMGDSVAVTDAHGLWQAHVHTDTPHVGVELGMEHGSTQIVVRNVLAGHDADRSSTGVVALTVCPGLAEPLADAGAVVLVVPEPGALKRRALRRAVRDASSDHAVIVAGHPHLRAAASDLAQRRRRPAVTVLDANHEGQVIAAVAAAAVVTPGQDLADEMAAAVARTRVGRSTGDALDDDVDAMVTPDTEVVSLVLASGVADGVAEAVRMSVAASAPGADVTVYRGGQAAPAVLIGVEARA